MSEPNAARHSPEATAAALPPELQPGTLEISQGFEVTPNTEVSQLDIHRRLYLQSTFSNYHPTSTHLKLSLTKKIQVDWKNFYDLSSLGSGSSRSLDRIAPHAINNNYDSYLFTINNTIKDFQYMLRLFDGNNDMIKITNSFLKPYIKEQKKLGQNALISHRLKN